MDTIECVICLNDISCNDHFTLTCCKNNVHISCLNDWVHQNITKKNIAKCFICSQENIILQDIVTYNTSRLNPNFITNHSNSIPIISNSNSIPIISNSNSNSNSIPIISNSNGNSIPIISNRDNINDIVIHRDNNFTTIAFNVDRRLYFLFIYVKFCFLVSMSSIFVFVLYYII